MGLEKFNDVLNGAGAIIVGVGLHGEAIDADGLWGARENSFGDVRFASLVGFDDGFDEILGDILVI